MSSLAFLGPQNAPKSLAAGDSPQVPLGAYSAPQKPLAGFNGVYFKAPTSKARERGKGALK